MNSIVSSILNGSIKKVIVLTGAGVSVSSGIPDFRSKGGLYDTLKPDLLTATPSQREELAHNPTAVVDIRLFQYNQFPYLEVRRPFILGTRRRQWLPTASHYFFKILDDKQLLNRLYTQNIDGLDYHTGIDQTKIISVHGSIETIECEFCKTPYDGDLFHKEVKEKIRNIYDIYDLEAPAESQNIYCPKCRKAAIKPATVLYGTNLPQRFFQSKNDDFPNNCDLLIIAGSSLTVHPACDLVTQVNITTPRILINREVVGTELGISSDTGRDHLIISDCDDGFIELARQLGWLPELYQYANDMCDNSKDKVTKAYEDYIKLSSSL